VTGTPRQRGLAARGDAAGIDRQLRSGQRIDDNGNIGCLARAPGTGARQRIISIVVKRAGALRAAGGERCTPGSGGGTGSGIGRSPGQRRGLAGVDRGGRRRERDRRYWGRRDRTAAAGRQQHHRPDDQKKI
jgi:hypothetical protein